MGERLQSIYTFTLKGVYSPRVLLFSFFIFILIYALHYFNCFYVPDADFFDFRAKAISLISFELPQGPHSYEHLPFYSVSMGLLSLALSGEDPILFAAELINLVSFLFSLLLIYLLSSRFLRKGAFVVVLLFALHPLTAHMTIQPRAEMLTLMFILLGIYLGSMDKRISYFPAFVASLTRYEGVILIISLTIKDLIFSKRKVLSIIVGFLSSLGILIWLYLNYKASGHLNPYYDYFGRELSSATLKHMKLGAAGLEYIKVVLAVLLNFIPTGGLLIKKVFAALVLLLAAIGFYSFFKKSLKGTLSLFFFLIGHLLIHFIYFTQAGQHVFLISWICYLSIVGGINWLAEFIDKAFHNLVDGIKANLYESETKMMFYTLVFGLATATLLTAGLSIFNNRSYAFWVAYTMSSGFILWFIIMIIDSSRLLNRLLIVTLAPILIFIIGNNILLIQESMESEVYSKAELRLVGEWYSQNAKNGEKIIVTEPRVAGYYADQMSYPGDLGIRYTIPIAGHYADNHGNFIFLGSFDASSYESFITELQNKKITYVVWNSHHGNLPRNEYYYRKCKIFLISDLSSGQDKLNFKLIKTVRVGPNYAFIYKFIP